jgi:UDP-N-acetylglucosamine 2-epimerase (non-hydrolysing)
VRAECRSGYLDFLALTSQARLILSYSDGLQEASTAPGIPCLTARPNTERPITVDLGTSTLVGNDAAKLRHGLRAILDGHYKPGRCPELWDGRAAERIARVLAGARGLRKAAWPAGNAHEPHRRPRMDLPNHCTPPACGV